jgi:TonB family protein
VPNMAFQRTRRPSLRSGRYPLCGGFIILAALLLGGGSPPLVHASAAAQVKTTPPVWIYRPLPSGSEVRAACPKTAPIAPVLEAHLLADGTMGEIKILRRGGCKAVDQLVTEYVKRWRFKPAVQNGKPISLWLTLATSIHAE